MQHKGLIFKHSIHCNQHFHGIRETVSKEMTMVSISICL